MKKEAREATRLAERYGVERAHVAGGDPHARLTGLVDGQPFSMVLSLSKQDASRYLVMLKCNIRREVRRLREAP